MAILIHPDGRQEAVAPKNGHKFTLEELQELVGGYVERVATIDNRVMYLDEDGRLKQLPINHWATELYKYGQFAGSEIVGRALVMTRQEEGS